MSEFPRSDENAESSSDHPAPNPSPHSPSESRYEAQESAETYRIPGGLSGWIPGEIPSGTTKPQRVSPSSEGNATAVERSPRGRTRNRTSRASQWEIWGFNLLVFVSSVCVMTLELTASRLIAKHVGSSLYTWTSVIGVVLAGITIGNSLGGWLADHYQRSRTLAWMFLLSSMACTSVLWLDQIVGGMPRPETVSWPAWVLTVVALMFLLPALLLGTTSPLVASMALERSTRLGSTVGNLYAWGAFGSIVGTFLTGFYLIDLFGTRAIVGGTAGTLALLAVLVAGGRWVFRTAVILGWLQLLGMILVAATISQSTAAAMTTQMGQLIALSADSTDGVSNWTTFGDNLGSKLHELGLILKLRDDEPGVYTDESSYSFIQVRDDVIEGSPVKALRLDKLDHSYFDTAEPTKLHYEYEQVYASVTRRAIPRSHEVRKVALRDFPGREAILGRLQEGAVFDPATNELILTNTNSDFLDELRSLSANDNYWQAIDQIHRDTTRSNWGGFSTVDVEPLPEEFAIPEEVRPRLSHDRNLQALLAYDVITSADRQLLIDSTEDAPWYAAIESFRKDPTPLNVLFIGGGGFIFPRWILAEYPSAERVDVAELDPAVYLAVKQEMGLSGTELSRIRTYIGDARNTVDDRLRELLRAREENPQAPGYDFIYGDAFNDFSVPWHLTTREFTEKLNELLSPGGVYLANIIEMYPRTEIPGGTPGETAVDLNVTAPQALFVSPGGAGEVKPEYAGLSVVPNNRLLMSGPMTPDLESRLMALDPENEEWQRGVYELAVSSRAPNAIPGECPKELIPSLLFNGSWTPCPSPFDGIDILQIDEQRHVLGIRGIATPSLHERLSALRADDLEWRLMIDAACERSHLVESGQFLGRYVNTMTRVFPYVAVFCTTEQHPSDSRDTFVVACAKQPLDLKNLESSGIWKITPFAEFQAGTGENPPVMNGQMAALLELAHNQILTDDYAPVDNLLKPVFADQGN